VLDKHLEVLWGRAAGSVTFLLYVGILTLLCFPFYSLRASTGDFLISFGDVMVFSEHNLWTSFAIINCYDLELSTKYNGIEDKKKLKLK